MHRYLLSLPFMLALFLSSCGDSDGDTDGETGNELECYSPDPIPDSPLQFAAAVYPIIEGRCSGSSGVGCHFGDVAVVASMLDMSDVDTAYGELVNVPSVQLPMFNLVEPGDPDNSYMWLKLLGAGIGGQMPAGTCNPSLCEEEWTTIYLWIIGGAMP